MQYEVATPAELPQWMRQSRRQIDWGFVLTSLIGLAMAWTIIVRPGIPVVSDLYNSAFMTSDLAAALREGQILPRWSAHSNFGYGAPVPSHIPQGAAYLAAVVEQLFTGDTSAAVAAVLSAALALAAMTMYGWIRALVSPTAAVLGATVYVLSPFVGHTAPHTLGDLPLVVSAALVPSVLWAGARIVQAPTRVSVILLTVGLTLQAAVHPSLALVAAVSTLAYALFVNRVAAVRVAACIGTAAMLFAPFWLPALMHGSFVTWIDNPIPDDRVFRLTDLLVPITLHDPALLNPAPVFGPGLPALALAGFGLLTLARKRARRGSIVLAALLLSCTLVGAVVQPATWWFLCVNAAAAMLAGAAAEWRYRLPSALRRAFVPAVMIGLAVGSAPVWLVSSVGTATEFSPTAQIAHQQQGLGAAILPPGQAIPTTLVEPVRADPNLVESYRQPLLVRIRPGAPVRVTPIYTQSHASAWQVSAMSPQTVVVSQAHYPGWQAYLDGVPLATERDPETGLIRIAIPQTASATLILAQSVTPAQWLAWVFVGLGAVALAAIVHFTSGSRVRELPRYDVSEARLTGIAVLALIAAVLLTASPDAPIALRADRLSSLADASLLSADAGPISLVAYRIDGSAPVPGGMLSLELFWMAALAPGQNVTIAAELVDLDQQPWALLSGPQAPGLIASRLWPAETLIRDMRRVSLPSDLPPGIYQVALSAYACEALCSTGQRIGFRDTRGTERRTLLLPQVIAVGGE
ncbi:MAG: hypothetical protein IPM16_02555 [Chloroflexi bacterium]|nr:hypothetical protein [Chloroflexota bacterium]